MPTIDEADRLDDAHGSLTGGDQRPVARGGALVGVRMPGVVELGEQQVGEIGDPPGPRSVRRGARGGAVGSVRPRPRSRSPDSACRMEGPGEAPGVGLHQDERGIDVIDSQQRHQRPLRRVSASVPSRRPASKPTTKESVMSWKSRRAQAAEYEGRALPRPDDEVVDQGLAFDISTLFNRRRALGQFLGVGAAGGLLAACGRAALDRHLDGVGVRHGRRPRSPTRPPAPTRVTARTGPTCSTERHRAQRHPLELRRRDRHRRGHAR